MFSRSKTAVLAFLLFGSFVFAYIVERSEAQDFVPLWLMGAASSVETYQLLSAAERALLNSYHALLESSAVRETGLEQLLRQLARNPPVAFVDGTPHDRDDYPYWPAANSCASDANVCVILDTNFAASIENAVLAALTNGGRSWQSLGMAPDTMQKRA